MTRTIGAALAGAAMLLAAAPATAAPFKEFADVTRRAPLGTTVIRDFRDSQNAVVYQLLLKRIAGDPASDEGLCQVHLRFVRAGRVEHPGGYVARSNATHTIGLIRGPYFAAQDSLPVDPDDPFLRKVPYLADQEWFATRSRAALRLNTAAVSYDFDTDECVAATDVAFSPQTSYLQRLDDVSQNTVGSAVIRSYPSTTNPVFVLRANYLSAGSTVRIGGAPPFTLDSDACALTLEINSASHWRPDLIAFSDMTVSFSTAISNNRYLIAARGGGELFEAGSLFLWTGGRDADLWHARDDDDREIGVFRLLGTRHNGDVCGWVTHTRFATKLERLAR